VLQTRKHAEREPDTPARNRFRAAIALDGVYDFISEYNGFKTSVRVKAEVNGPDLSAAAWSETYQAGMGAPPWLDAQRYLRNSPLMGAASIHTPLLLIHGDLDELVPLAQAEEMFTALYRLNKDAVFVRYWGEGHVPHSPANIRDVWNRIFRWLDQYIGPPMLIQQSSGRLQ